MKKMMLMLMALCLMCSGTALADIPKFEDMPAMILLDSFFEGTWVGTAAFAGETYVDFDTLADIYGITVPVVTIREQDRLVIFEGTDETGAAFREEYPYSLENSQLECQDEEGQVVVFELLEDRNIVMNMFVPGENEGMIDISIFMIRADAESK